MQGTDVILQWNEVLLAGGQHERAALVRDRARLGAKRKAEQLAEPLWRTAYAAIPEIAALLRPSLR
jgi:hypothetical protein